ncbi:hypothetical protein N566_04210 [Streptomycetaceae bacterium MP113-05]|nr:hypothetical protein N566_04210 [Streptomycetaceae bacterium MP113-05]
MRRHAQRLLAAVSTVAALAVAAPAAVATPQTAESAGLQARPNFKVPFLCGQTWVGSNWNGHSPAHSIDWNHYSADGARDDYNRRVFASAGGTVLSSYYSTSTGYGNTIVIGHGNGWQTRYAHLRTRAVQKGDRVKLGQKIGRVGKSSALYNITAHLHYEQIHNGNVVVAVVQHVRWNDYLKRSQRSNNSCG